LWQTLISSNTPWKSWNYIKWFNGPQLTQRNYSGVEIKLNDLK
jgi:hypothetical protein